MKLPTERQVLTLVLVVGAGLRLWQYLAQTSLWIDEIALSENVIHTPLASLLSEPLALDQIAPPGFLAAEKAAVALFGPNELALRLFPLLGGLAGLALFALLARRVLPGWTAVFATALFAVAPTLVAYSAEVKQYSTDVAVTILLTLFALALVDAPASRSRLAGAAVVGAAAVWFSQPAVLTLAGLAAGLAWLALRRGGWKALPPLLPVFVVWAASAAAATLHGYRALTPETREYMQRFWDPSLPRPTVLALVLLGAAVLSVKRPRTAPLLLAPVLVALAAAAAHRYPFSGRSILFLTPVAILAIADALDSISAGLTRLHVPRPVFAAVLTIALVILIDIPLPVYRNEETRPVLSSLAARRQPGDALYVFYGAERAVRFYGPRFGIDVSETVLGGCHRDQPRDYLRELDRLRGRQRAWIVFAHASSRLAEQKLMRSYLGTIGTRTEGHEAAGAMAELYDLSDPERLREATAESFPLPGGNPGLAARIGCGHGPLAETPPSWTTALREPVAAPPVRP